MSLRVPRKWVTKVSVLLPPSRGHADPGWPRKKPWVSSPTEEKSPGKDVWQTPLTFSRSPRGPHSPQRPSCPVLGAWAHGWLCQAAAPQRFMEPLKPEASGGPGPGIALPGGRRALGSLGEDLAGTPAHVVLSSQRALLWTGLLSRERSLQAPPPGPAQPLGCCPDRRKQMLASPCLPGRILGTLNTP